MFASKPAPGKMWRTKRQADRGVLRHIDVLIFHAGHVFPGCKPKSDASLVYASRAIKPEIG